MLTILVFVMAFPYHASYNFDKRCPAGLGMSLEWKCVPQLCVQNDHTVVYSLNCDGAHLLSSSSQRANQKSGIKLKKESTFASGMETLIVRGRDTIMWDFSLCVSECF